MLTIILNAMVQADSIGSWAVGLVFTGVVFFAGNRITKLMEKIDLVAEFVVSQLAKNGHYDKDIADIRKEHEKLEADLTAKFDRMERKMDEFIKEVRRDRIT